jgi:cell pole-organizing protein PopZ
VGRVFGAYKVEFKVDDLLSNVRKAVDDDINSIGVGTTTQTRGTLMRGALREMRISMNADQAAVAPQPKQSNVREEISDLRDRIKKRMAAMESESLLASAQPAPPPPSKAMVPVRNDFSGIMSDPQPSGYGFEDPLDGMYEHQADQNGWHDPHRDAQPHNPYARPEPYGYPTQAYAQDPYALEAPIISPDTQAHTETAFRQLSDSLLARATGDRSLEDMTREMLRTMLKQWLDEHLPGIVEDMVRDEIQRVARRGR